MSDTGIPQNNTIEHYLSTGGEVGSARTYLMAENLLMDFEGTLPNYASSFQSDMLLKKLAITYIQEVILNVAWYTKNIRRAVLLRNVYISTYILLLVTIPLALLWYENHLEAPRSTGITSGNSLITQLILGITVVAALQQLGNSIMAVHQRYGIWWRTASSLKQIWFSTVSTWSDADPSAPEKSIQEFGLDLNASIAKARELVTSEQQDFFDNLARPFPDILNLLSSTSKAVNGLVSDAVGGHSNADASASTTIKARKEIARQQSVISQLDLLIADAAKKLQNDTDVDKTFIAQTINALTTEKNTAIKARIAAAAELAAASA